MVLTGAKLIPGYRRSKYHDGRLFVHELNYSSENETMDNLSQTQILALREHEEGLSNGCLKIEHPKRCNNSLRQ